MLLVIFTCFIISIIFYYVMYKARKIAAIIKNLEYSLNLKNTYFLFFFNFFNIFEAFSNCGETFCDLSCVPLVFSELSCVPATRTSSKYAFAYGRSFGVQTLPESYRVLARLDARCIVFRFARRSRSFIHTN